MTGDVPRKRVVAALLLTGAVFGAGLGLVDRARGVAPAASALFSRPPACSLSPSGRGTLPPSPEIPCTGGGGLSEAPR